MSSEPNKSMLDNGAEPSDSGANGWPNRTERPAEWWGRRHNTPVRGDTDRLRVFVKPFIMSQEERNRILSNWQKVTKGWPETRAMNPELRPSTPREVRADQKIEQLSREGVKVDTRMERHIRNVVVRSSGLHEALRHYTEGESNLLIPYLNEMLHREDRMLVEWAKQRKADHEFYVHPSQYGGSSRGSSDNDKASSHKQSQVSTPERTFEELIEDEASFEQSGKPADDPSQILPTESVKEKPHPSEVDEQRKDDVAQSSSRQGPAGAWEDREGQAQAQQTSEDKAKAAHNVRMAMILELEAQISQIDRRIYALGGQVKSATPGENPWFHQQEPFDRVFELMRSILEEKQRRLFKLNQQKPNKPQGGKGGFLGACANAWKRCGGGEGSNYSSPSGSRIELRDIN